MGVAALDKPVFTKDQMISATEVARKFSEARKRAKKAPLGIIDRSGLSSVLMDYDQYEKMFVYIQELEEKLLEAEVLKRSKELEADPSSAVPWRKVRRTPGLKDG